MFSATSATSSPSVVSGRMVQFFTGVGIDGGATAAGGVCWGRDFGRLAIGGSVLGGGGRVNGGHGKTARLKAR